MFTAMALPDNAATDFISADGNDMVVRAEERRDTPLEEQISIAKEADDAEVFIKLVNEGNIIDMIVNL